MAAEDKNLENQIQNCAKEGDYEKLLKLYDEMFPDDMVPTLRPLIPYEEPRIDLADVVEDVIERNNELKKIIEENDTSEEECEDKSTANEIDENGDDLELALDPGTVTTTKEEKIPPDPFTSLMKKADFMSSYGKGEEALKIYKTLISMKTTEEGEDGRTVLTMKRKIGGILHYLRKYEEALKILNAVLKKQIEIFGNENENENDSTSTKPDVYETKLVIAKILESQGKSAEALKIYEEVYEIFSEFYGDEVDQSAHILFNIKSLRLKTEGTTDLENILKIVDYGPTVFSIKYHWDDGRDTILHRVVKTNNEDMVRVVVEEIITKSEGFDEQVVEFLNFENSEFQTPLTLAVSCNCGKAVKYLLENGISKGLDVNKITTSGHSALSIAEQRKNNEIKNILLEHEAVLLSYRVAPPI